MLRKLSLGLSSVVVLYLLILTTVAEARTINRDTGGKSIPVQAQTAALAQELRVHNVGNFWLSVTNRGIFGSQAGDYADPCTRRSAPSGEFPGGSGLSYLFQGAMWIGAIVGEGSEAETLVSVGNDGWFGDVIEYLPIEPFRARTIRPAGIQQGSCFIPFSDSAVSEQDFITAFADTCYDPIVCPNDPFDGQLKPIGLKVTQKSYAWSYDYAQDFVLFDYLVENINVKKLNNVYLALYLDPDVYSLSEDPGGFNDDVSGFLNSVPSFRCRDQFQDTINVAWVADNNGLSNCVSCRDNQIGVFLPNLSPTGITGTRVVKAPGNLQFSFNWWNSQGDKPSLDWGPWKLQNLLRRPQKFGEGVLGTPGGNASKYFMMSNGEFDYDQLSAALPIWSDSGWIPCPQGLCEDVADGYDTRYVLSFGPFNINPGQTLPLTLTYVAGADFHVSPSDWGNYVGKFTDPQAFQTYMASKDVSDFATNARWAGWVYDNPGVDTDSDGYKGKSRICEGETVYYEGDGIPDFQGPPPPSPPVLRFETSQGKVIVRWNGRHTEITPDYFSGEQDFEGYRIHLSRTGFPDDYALLDSYDKLDYKMYVYNPANQKWSLKMASLSADSITKIFANDNSCCYSDEQGGCTCVDTSLCKDPDAIGNNPLKWTKDYPFLYRGICESLLQITPSVEVRTGYKIYFERQDWNKGLFTTPDSIFKRVYEKEIKAGTITPADSEYYEYQYTIDSLTPSQPVFIAVTAFDFGNPQTSLSPLETSPLVNAKMVWPLAAPPTGTEGKKVVVYPNPYKITEAYLGENRSLPAGKLIHFRQLPGKCTIRIFTLDGDEVAIIRNEDATNSDITWDLISNNNQEVVAGIYIFHVESARGSQVGKFAVIK